jgi:hypothetical protein
LSVELGFELETIRQANPHPGVGLRAGEVRGVVGEVIAALMNPIFAILAHEIKTIPPKIRRANGTKMLKIVRRPL